MLKMGGKGNRNGKPISFIVVGLSHKNLEELKKKHPIACSIRDFGVDADIDIIIFSGETEQAMQREMSDLIGVETEVRIDPRLRD